MPKNYEKQLPLCQPAPNHLKAIEMADTNTLLDQNCSKYKSKGQANYA